MRLQKQNPQGYQQVNELMQNKGNAQEMLQQIMSKATPEQKQNILNQAKAYGCPENVLSQVQNMK